MVSEHLIALQRRFMDMQASKIKGGQRGKQPKKPWFRGLLPYCPKYS